MTAEEKFKELCGSVACFMIDARNNIQDPNEAYNSCIKAREDLRLAFQVVTRLIKIGRKV